MNHSTRIDCDYPELLKQCLAMTQTGGICTGTATKQATRLIHSKSVIP